MLKKKKTKVKFFFKFKSFKAKTDWFNATRRWTVNDWATRRRWASKNQSRRRVQQMPFKLQSIPENEHRQVFDFWWLKQTRHFERRCLSSLCWPPADERHERDVDDAVPPAARGIKNPLSCSNSDFYAHPTLSLAGIRQALLKASGARLKTLPKCGLLSTHKVVEAECGNNQQFFLYYFFFFSIKRTDQL